MEEFCLTLKKAILKENTMNASQYVSDQFFLLLHPR